MGNGKAGGQNFHLLSENGTLLAFLPALCCSVLYLPLCLPHLLCGHLLSERGHACLNIYLIFHAGENEYFFHLPLHMHYDVPLEDMERSRRQRRRQASSREEGSSPPPGRTIWQADCLAWWHFSTSFLKMRHMEALHKEFLEMPPRQNRSVCLPSPGSLFA